MFGQVVYKMLDTRQSCLLKDRFFGTAGLVGFIFSETFRAEIVSEHGLEERSSSWNQSVTGGLQQATTFCKIPNRR